MIPQIEELMTQIESGPNLRHHFGNLCNHYLKEPRW